MNLLVNVIVKMDLEVDNVMNAKQTIGEIQMLNVLLATVILWIQNLYSVITKQENVPVLQVCITIDYLIVL